MARLLQVLPAVALHLISTAGSRLLVFLIVRLSCRSTFRVVLCRPLQNLKLKLALSRSDIAGVSAA